MRFLLYLFCIVGFCVDASFSQSKQATELARGYLEVSNRQFGETSVPLVKWEGRDTLYYAVIGKSRFFPMRSWTRHADEVGKLTGLKFMETPDPDHYDILVFLGTLTDFYAHIGQEPPAVFNPSSPSWISGNWDTSYRLTKAFFCMNDASIQDGLYAEFLLRRGLLELIGLRGRSGDKSSLLHPSFDREAKNYALTADDKRFLTIHYSPAVRAGTTYGSLQDSLAFWVDLEAVAKRRF